MSRLCDITGAVPVKDNDKDSNSADINMSFGGFHLGVKAAGFQTPDSQDKVVAFYKSSLSGFTVASSMDMGTSSMTVYQSPKYGVTVMVSAESKTTGISLNVASK